MIKALFAAASLTAVQAATADILMMGDSFLSYSK